MSVTDASIDLRPSQEAALQAWEAVVSAARDRAQKADEGFKALRLQAITSLEEEGCDRRDIAAAVGVTPGAISYLVGRKEGRPPGAPRGRGAKKVSSSATPPSSAD